MAGAAPAAAKGFVKIYPAGTGIAVLGGLLRSDPGIPVLRSIWKTFSACVFGLFRRGVIVEKNLLWYNQCMGKRRRSTEFKNNSQVIDMEEARARRQQKRRAEKEKKEEKELRAKQQNTRGKRAIRRSKTRRKIITGITIAIIVLLVFLLVFNIISLKKEQYDTKKEQQALKQQKAELQKELENAETPENIEAQARQQLRLIKPGEVLYMFPSEITDRDDSSTGGQKGDSSQ